MNASDRDEIFGKYLPVIYLRSAKLGKGTWVVKEGSPYKGGPIADQRALGFRSWERAIAEADYQARAYRWRAAQQRADQHECEACDPESVYGRQQRIEAARRCPYNVSAWWLGCHTEPQPPEA